MEAHFLRATALVAAFGLMGASQRSANFVVTASTPEIAAQVSRAAETFRRDLAVQWLGSPMPNWAQPCPIEVHVAPNLGAGGATSFLFEHGEVFGWQMNIQGSLERVLDSVLPHEITHTIFATHFRRPLPRWADEGSCTTVEHASERMKQQMMLVDFLRTNRGIPFSRMFMMKEYPHDVMPLYSQGYSVARYLIAQGGRHKFLEFLGDGMQDENWARAMQAHYGYVNLASLQANWLDWVRKGSPNLEIAAQPAPSTPPPTTLVSNERRPRPETSLIYRGQEAANQGPTPGPVDDPQPLARLINRTTNMPAAGERPDQAAATPAIARPSQGWHVPNRRVISDSVERDGAPAESTAENTSAPASSPDQSATSIASPAAATTGHQVTRQLPIQQSRQIILEWSRP